MSHPSATPYCWVEGLNFFINHFSLCVDLFLFGNFRLDAVFNCIRGQAPFLKIFFLHILCFFV